MSQSEPAQRLIDLRSLKSKSNGHSAESTISLSDEDHRRGSDERGVSDRITVQKDHGMVEFIPEHLILGCKNQDPDSQEQIYKRFYGYAMAIALKYCSDKNDALEVVNDGFIKVFDKMDRFEPSKPFKPWLRRIIINTAIDRMRAILKYKNNTEFQDDYVNVLSEADSDMNVEQIYRLINRLPPMHRFVFNLYEIDGYRHSEVAKMLNISESSSRTYLSRAKEELRKMFKTLFPDSYE